MRYLTTGVGRAIRETGQALDRLGMRAQGDHSFKEKFCRHRQVMHLFDKHPYLATDSWVAPNAAVIGDVQIGDKSSVWYGCVLRGDQNSIKIGAMTNIQDRTVIHTAKSLASGFPATATIGNYVTIGHGSTIYSSTIMDESVIGIGCVLDADTLVESHAMLAAGSVVPSGTRIPSGQLWGGNPAKFVRDLTEEEIGGFQKKAIEYTAMAASHAEEFLPYGSQYLDAERLKESS